MLDGCLTAVILCWWPGAQPGEMGSFGQKIRLLARTGIRNGKCRSLSVAVLIQARVEGQSGLFGQNRFARQEEGAQRVGVTV